MPQAAEKQPPEKGRRTPKEQPAPPAQERQPEAPPVTLALWNAVEKTNPYYTKQFSRGGGFKGTAINAIYLIKKATEQWGPMGQKWGVRIIDEKVMKGAPVLNGDGIEIAKEQVHVVRVEVWGPNGICAPGFGQTTFVGRNKNGMFTDEEAPKKSLTDAVSKALSWLGFSADVHLGLFDDNKYVNDRRAEEASRRAAEHAPPPPPADLPPTISQEQRDNLSRLLAGAGIEVERFLQAGGLSALDDLAAGSYTSALGWIERNKKQPAAAQEANDGSA